MDVFFDSNINSDLFVFEAEIDEFLNLKEFSYRCSYEVHIQHNKVLAQSSFSALQLWDKSNISFLNIPLSRHSFFEKRQLCIEEREVLVNEIIEKEFEKAFVLSDDWDEIFIVAKFKNKYIGYLWETGV